MQLIRFWIFYLDIKYQKFFQNILFKLKDLYSTYRIPYLLVKFHTKSISICHKKELYLVKLGSKCISNQLWYIIERSIFRIVLISLTKNEVIEILLNLTVIYCQLAVWIQIQRFWRKSESNGFGCITNIILSSNHHKISLTSDAI